MKLDKLQQAGIGIALILLVALFTEFIYLKNDKLSIIAVTKKNEELNSKIQVAKNIQKNALQLQEEMTHLQSQLERLKKILPLSINKPLFMKDMKRYANEFGLEIVKLSSNETVRDDVILENPFTYIARGTYHDFGAFFAQISNYPRIVNVKGLSITREKDNPAYTVNSSFILSVFTYKEPSEEEIKAQIADRKAAKTGKGKGKGKKKKKRG